MYRILLLPHERYYEQFLEILLLEYIDMQCIYVNNAGFKSVKLFYNIPSYYHFSKLAISFPIIELLDVIDVA